MELLLFGVLFGLPLLLLAAGATYAYYDAPKYDMNPQKWAVISFFIPFFGFFAYIFERDERKPDTHDRDEHFVDGPFEIHKSRADDTPLASTPEEKDEPAKSEEDDSWGEEDTWGEDARE